MLPIHFKKDSDNREERSQGLADTVIPAEFKTSFLQSKQVLDLSNWLKPWAP